MCDDLVVEEEDYGRKSSTDEFGDKAYEEYDPFFDYEPIDPADIIELAKRQPSHQDLKVMIQLMGAANGAYYNSYGHEYKYMARIISSSMKASSPPSKMASVWRIISKGNDGTPRKLEIANDKKVKVPVPTEDAETIMTDVCWRIAAGMMIELIGAKRFVSDPVTLIVSYIKIKYHDVSVRSLLYLAPDDEEVGNREESVELHGDWSDRVIMAKVLNYEGQGYERFPRSQHPWNFGPDGLPYM